ncbi:MAG: yecD [Hyphomicrobiales bacterium]|nr:yecD [Hyphomicrobiales bacterium]
MAKISRLQPLLSAQNTGLILFDALNGYLHPADSNKVTFLKERNILENMRSIKEAAKKVGMTTFYPSGAHAEDGSDAVMRLTDTDMNLGAGGGSDAPIRPPFHKGSKDAEIALEVAPIKGDVIIPKRRWNSFFQTDLDLQFRVRGIDTFIICGGSTDVGIASTVFAARDLDYGIVVVKDCCYSARGNNNQFFMERVFPRMGRVMNLADTIELLRA